MIGSPPGCFVEGWTSRVSYKIVYEMVEVGNGINIDMVLGSEKVDLCSSVNIETALGNIVSKQASADYH